ncbi:MAG: HAD family hydrolase [Kofleriaceae bacterium]|nr:HAD family hydrolase [Kofleriaceae bacterium]
MALAVAHARRAAVADALAARIATTGATPALVAADGAPARAGGLRRAPLRCAGRGHRPARPRPRRRAALNGDRPEPPAARVATAVGIDEVHAGVDPAGKVAVARAGRPRRDRPVGDGINDAPALAAALGRVAQAAAPTSPAPRPTSRPAPGAGAVAGLIGVARGAVRTMRRNLYWAACYNVVTSAAGRRRLAPWGRRCRRSARPARSWRACR